MSNLSPESHGGSQVYPILTFFFASITTFISYLQSMSLGAVTTGILAIAGVVGTLWSGIKNKQREDGQKQWDIDLQHRREAAEVDTELMRQKAKAAAEVDQIESATRDRKIAELQLKLTEQATKIAEQDKAITDRDIQWRDWRERYHAHKNESQSILTKAQIEAAEARRKADELQAQLDAQKAASAIVKDKVRENTTAIGQIAAETHVTVDTPGPLSDSDEMDTLLPPSSL